MSVGVSGPYLARLLGGWRAAGPAYVALARALRLLILDGRLPLRTRLPGERELADALGVSRTTATAAYAQLRDEGFLASRRGSGSWTPLPGYFEAGLSVLRTAIAERFTRRGAPTTPDQILVTSGALHAVSLLLRVF